MTLIVQKKDPLVVPPSVQRRARIKTGDRLEFKVSGGIINIIPKLPSADDEYTPAQRRIIYAQLAEAAKGPYHGPFDTADEMIAHIKGELKKENKDARAPVQPAPNAALPAAEEIYDAALLNFSATRFARPRRRAA